jgi:hypothetical protein
MHKHAKKGMPSHVQSVQAEQLSVLLLKGETSRLHFVVPFFFSFKRVVACLLYLLFVAPVSRGQVGVNVPVSTELSTRH